LTALKLAPLAGCALALAWLAGFLWFVADVERPQAIRVNADGIVVLTGGADRVAAGLHLLREGRGRVLLISGVGGGVDLATLARQSGVDVAPLAGRITLGRAATTTIGNADETAAWVRDQGLHSLLVVTASYHMKRAMTELGRTLPEIRLIPAPVIPPALRGGGGVATVRLLAHEYTKWLAAELGLSRLGAGPLPEPGQEPG
jgi:uncharacterized SAM-binding protein YcdF (DUF218 family)